MSQGHRDINGSTICPKCGGSDNYNLCTCKENGIWRKRHGLPEKSFEVEVEEGASFEYPVIMKGKVIYVSITKFSEALSRKEVEELICSLQTLMEDSDRKEKETLQRPEPQHWYDGMFDCELETLQNNEVSLGDLVEVKTYIQNKGWEWLGLVGTVTIVGDEKRCYRVDYGDTYSFYDSDQIRKANSDITGN
jgi:hypothetical protein